MTPPRQGALVGVRSVGSCGLARGSGACTPQCGTSVQLRLQGWRREDASETPTTRIFIGYFPRSTKSRDVRAEVERYGDVEEVMLGGGNDGGDLFCFVQFKRVQDAARAKAAIHGHTMPAVAGARQLISVFKEPRRGY